MKQYRKKPVTIEAVQFNGLNPAEIKDFVGENCEVEIYDNEVTPPVARIVIHTLEGDMEVSNGDYVIKGVKGEFYPCKPDIFQQTYESEEPDKSLKEAAYKYSFDSRPSVYGQVDAIDAFITGAMWQKSQMISALKNDGELPIEFIDKFHEIDRNAFQNGQKNMKEQMLKDAVERTVMDFSSNQPRPQVDILLDPHKYHTGDKVRILVLKAEE